jgi:hypothetical protein
MCEKGKAKPREWSEILRMRRRISAKMGRLQRISPPWTPQQQREWEKLYEINIGISWCLGSQYIFPPFVTQEEASSDEE